LTTGTGTTPYYLSITANANGHKPITLVDDPSGTPVNLLATADDGANTEFKINGAAVSKSGTLINDVVPGITFNILDTTSGPEKVTLTLASDRSRLQSSLETFVAQYNSVVSQVDAQVGPSAGQLTGNFLLREVAGALREVASYHSSSGSVQSLIDLGVEFDAQGKASFNQTTFDTLSDTHIQDAFTFLGSETSGLGALAGKFTQLSDPVTGLIKVEQDQYDKTDKALTDQVAILTERVSVLRLSVTAKLQAADSLLAGLESQRSVLDASIQSLNLTLYGKNES
jgi:flagellar hook-associated protein 2